MPAVSLRELVKSHINNDRELSLELSQLDSPAVNELRLFFQDGVFCLVNVNITEEPEQKDCITLTGTGSGEPFAGMQVTAAFDWQDQTPALAIEAKPVDDNWTLDKSFEVLGNSVTEDLIFSQNTRLYLNSHSVGTQPQGMTLDGNLAPNPLLEALKSLLKKEAQTLSGQIKMNNGVPEMELALHGRQLHAQTGNIESFPPFGDVVFKLVVTAGYSQHDRRYLAHIHIALCTQIEFQANNQKYILPLAASMRALDSRIRFSTNLTDLIKCGLDELKAFFHGHDLSKLLPKSFNLADYVKLTNLLVEVDPGEMSIPFISMGVQTARPWIILRNPDQSVLLALNELAINFQLEDPLHDPVLGVCLQGEAAIGQGALELNAFYPEFSIAGYLKKDTVISIADLVGHFHPTGNAKLPDLVIDILDFAADVSENKYSAEVNLNGAWSLIPSWPDFCIERVHFDFAYSKNSTRIKTQGVVRIAKSVFTITADYPESGQGWEFSAVWHGAKYQDGSSATLGINDAAQALGIKTPLVPKEFDINLTGAGFNFHTWNERFTFLGTSQSFYFKDIIFDSKSTDNARSYVFKVDFPDIVIEKLPLIGQALAPLDFSIRNISILVSSKAYKSYDLPVPGPGGDLDKISYKNQDIAMGVAFTLSLHLGKDFQKDNGGPIYDQAAQPLDPKAGLSAAADSNFKETGQVFWLNVQKALGPIHLQKIGVGWRNKELCLLLDAGLTASGLTIDLINFGINAPPTDLRDIHVSLDGMSIQFKNSGVEIAGAFERSVDQGKETYSGEVIIKAGPINLFAVGSYETIDGHPSMFIFAMMNVPLGGPPFFFVTGLAAGFGYNRGLNLPTIDTLEDFPLVEGAKGAADPKKVLADMKTGIQAAYGENWLAAGVKFTSFELVQSVAILTVSFGTKLEIALLGTATISIPAKTAGKITPLAKAVVVLEAVYSSETQSLKVMGKLAAGAYVLSQDCRLTGGFAFYTWFGGPNQGDFVVTLGGYHPHYNVPAHYPSDVPRLGVNWKIGKNLNIKGGLYFALTPVCVMAGGNLEVLFQKGGVRAWLTAQANFIIYWKPFYYSADFGVHIDVSYTFKIFGSSNTLSYSLGVAVSLHGPNFGGSIEVDVYVVSFTIAFGESHSQHTPISWDDFKQSFLIEHPGKQALKRLAAYDEQKDKRVVCFAKVIDGLSRDLSQETAEPAWLKDLPKMDWIVNPKELAIEISTVIPVKCIGVNQPLESLEIKKDADWNTNFGSVPMNVKTQDFVSKMAVELRNLDDQSLVPETESGFVFENIIGNSPQSLWADRSLDFSQAGLNKLLGPDAFTANTLMGMRLRRQDPHADQTCPVDLEKLLYDPSPFSTDFKWGTAGSGQFHPYTPGREYEEIKASLADDKIQARRNELVAGLAACGLVVDQKINLRRMQADPSDGLIDPPILCALGDAA